MHKHLLAYSTKTKHNEIKVWFRRLQMGNRPGLFSSSCDPHGTTDQIKTKKTKEYLMTFAGMGKLDCWNPGEGAIRTKKVRNACCRGRAMCHRQC